MLHEIAHVVGLNHVNEPTELMAATNSGQTRLRPAIARGLPGLARSPAPSWRSGRWLVDQTDRRLEELDDDRRLPWSYAGWSWWPGSIAVAGRCRRDDPRPVGFGSPPRAAPWSGCTSRQSPGRCRRGRAAGRVRPDVVDVADRCIAPRRAADIVARDQEVTEPAGRRAAIGNPWPPARRCPRGGEESASPRRGRRRGPDRGPGRPGLGQAVKCAGLWSSPHRASLVGHHQLDVDLLGPRSLWPVIRPIRVLATIWPRIARHPAPWRRRRAGRVPPARAPRSATGSNP